MFKSLFIGNAPQKTQNITLILTIMSIKQYIRTVYTFSPFGACFLYKTTENRSHGDAVATVYYNYSKMDMIHRSVVFTDPHGYSRRSRDTGSARSRSRVRYGENVASEYVPCQTSIEATGSNTRLKIKQRERPAGETAETAGAAREAVPQTPASRRNPDSTPRSNDGSGSPDRSLPPFREIQKRTPSRAGSLRSRCRRTAKTGDPPVGSPKAESGTIVYVS